MIGPLNSQLNAIKWGEFRLGDLFEKRTMRGYPKKDENLTENKNGYHVFGQNIKHQYPQKVLLDEKYLHRISPKKPILAYASSVGEIGLIKESFYRSGDNGAFQGLFPRFKDYNVRHLLFILSKLKNIFNDFGYATGMSDVLNLKFSLPLKPTANAQTLEDIDFTFMEKFIAELEQCRLAELEAYLKATGLSNTTLSNDEENALNVFNNSWGGNTPCGLTWQSFRLGDLFEVLSYKKRFDANKVNIYASKTKDTYPYVVRTSLNNGIRGYLKENTNFLNAGNTISFGQDTATMFYQEKPYFTGDKIKILRCKNPNFNKINALFFITSLTKAFRNFSWGSASFSVSIIENQNVSLPTNPHGGIDFNFMRTLINALMKQTIQGVVQYSGAKKEATKEIISQEVPVQKDSLF
ncbi:restriction endonuclease subunit S [Helicobacter pylori]|uniref:restriction endonuclease subunit S n=1 Tax=Helicobacter pylori TaxID=210 RepID=UPI000FDDF8D6|nr:restriction endonuclease subunit S [Helicobacter pylori]RVZ24911.1 type II restriction endonuclease [Helicobacter pylori]